MVVYADEFEGLAAVIASTQMNIPTAHIEGGDLTEGGALDDSVRHAMTKLSHIHLQLINKLRTEFLEWVKKIGESIREFPAIDLISQSNYATSEEIEKNLHLDTSRPIVLFTQHSVTTEFDESKNHCYFIRSYENLQLMEFKFF